MVTSESEHETGPFIKEEWFNHLPPGEYVLRPAIVTINEDGLTIAVGLIAQGPHAGNYIVLKTEKLP